MYGIRWLPAVVFAFASCIVTPDAHAQAWLRWGKAPARQQADPSKRIVPLRQGIAAPVATPEPRIAAPALPAASRGPTVTISEEAPPAVVSAAASPSQVRAIPVAASPVPKVSVVAEQAPLGATDVAPIDAVPLGTAPDAPLPSLPPIGTATLELPETQIAEATAPTPPAAIAMTAVAPPAVAPPCSDCPTLDELKATSHLPAAAEMTHEGQKIQSEIKRRLLQGR